MWLNRSFKTNPTDQANRSDSADSKVINYEQIPYELVSAQTVDEAACDLIKPADLGFDPLKKRMWVKQAASDIVQMFSLCATKGAGYVFRWGVSLAFVPHQWDTRPKFHRTIKSARYDLFETAGEFIAQDLSFKEMEPHWIEGHRGENTLRQTMRRAWKTLYPYLEAWFSQTASFEGVLFQAQNQITRKWDSFRHFPDPKLIAAFTQARVGKLEEARQTLNLLIAEQAETYGGGVLTQALMSVGASSNPASN